MNVIITADEDGYLAMWPGGEHEAELVRDGVDGTWRSADPLTDPIAGGSIVEEMLNSCSLGIRPGSKGVFTLILTKPYCCQRDCKADAEFTIYGESGHPEDNIDACEAHVGELLGTPQFLLPKENKSWTIVAISPCT